METIAYEPTLHDLLLQQVRIMNLNPIVLGCCEVVISGLDDDGYLESHPADLAMAAGASLEQIRGAVEIVQQLEPAGVGAQDLRERLLLQLERQGKGEDLAARIVRDHLQDVAGNRLSCISSALHISLAELTPAFNEICGLSPRLMDKVVSDNYVYPEVLVHEREGCLRASMNNCHLPNLFISQHHRQLLSDPDTSDETRSYVKNKIRGAVFMFNTILQRQSTLERISQSIVDVQKEFFRHGMDHLKPLTMAWVAKDVGVHETTVSRAVAGKYLRCRFGLFPIRMFFCSGCPHSGGRSVSNIAIKNTLRRLIEKEDSFTPLSDNQIAQLLRDQGLKVARRTVAKYRENLGIPPCQQRRKDRIAL